MEINPAYLIFFILCIMEEKTPLQKVVDVLINYYGEDKVDLQKGEHYNIIMIYFPKVTVTNEYDKSIDITELYAKIRVNDEGKLEGSFTLNRAEYTAEQYNNNYMHSHVKYIPRDLTDFQPSCLGYGPIRDTCTSLNVTFDEDIWTMFALELDKYVHTESVSGVPYHKLESIGAYNSATLGIAINRSYYNPVILNGLSTPNKRKFNKFLRYMLNNMVLSFNFINKYSIADSDYNIVVKMSNLFIEWYNNLTLDEQDTLKEDMFDSGLLIICTVSNEKFIRKVAVSDNYTRLKSMIGTPLWKFKGETVRLNIIINNSVAEEYSENDSTILNPDLVMYIINEMERIVNYRYGRESSESNQKAAYL